jgi:hypothetical protein
MSPDIDTGLLGATIEENKIDISQRIGPGKRGEVVGVYIDQISKAEPKEVQSIAASQISLPTSYYNAVLTQANLSFRWALVAAGIGLVLFLAAIVFLLTTQIESIGIISVVGGGIVEVIAGINFMLYGKTTDQLADFHERLDQTQRFLLANSICESLEGNAKQQARAELIHVIASARIGQPIE